MRDQYGRELSDLRVSLTDRCNLRCVYCMPSGTVAFRPPAELLQDDEVVLLVRIAAELGVRKVRLTGGEPTLRAGAVDLVRRIAAIPELDDIAMTTNGMLLESMAAGLAAAGLRRVNVSLDTLDQERHRRITRGGLVERVLAGISAAEEAGLGPIKVNAVVVRGFNEEGVADLAALSLLHPWEIRFIEVMPFGPTDGIAGGGLVRSDETMARIEARMGRLEPVDLSGRQPARVHRLPGAAGTIGFVSASSEPFCTQCGRLRLTADGRLRLCLLDDAEVDLMTPLRHGAPIHALKTLFRAAAFRRPLGGAVAQRSSPSRLPPSRPMFRIGG